MRIAIRPLIAGVTVATLIACGGPPPATTVTGVSIDGGDRTIIVGDPLTLTATVATTGGASTTVTWTSSNEAVATIDAAGNVDSLTDGTTEITATSTTNPGKGDTITLDVDPPGALRWTHQFGTNGFDQAMGIATDADGNVSISGYTAADAAGGGASDAFIRSYDSAGNLRWAHTYGTFELDYAVAIATDANGHTYATGYTLGALAGSSAGGYDAFIRSYDRDGNLRWTRQFGTSSDDFAGGIAADANGDVFLSGSTAGDLDGQGVPAAGGLDAFVRSYDRDGNHRWTRQFGTDAYDDASGIAADARGNVYISGDTSGVLEGGNAGSSDAFVRSYDRDGNHRWTRQFGTSSDEAVNEIASDANGHTYTTGRTGGALVGSSAGGTDAFIRSYGR